MGGFSLLGHLAGGYAQAAEQERRRQFEAEMQQRQNALGLSKILLENPAVPPEYKGLIGQYAMNVVNSKGKIPDFHKEVVMQTPQIGTAAKTQQAQIPQVNLGMPAPIPMPQGIGTGQQQGAPSLTQGATQANGGAFPSIGPRGALPPVAPPPVPIQMTTGPNGEQIPVMTPQGGPTVPGRQQAVTQAQSADYTPAGQFRIMSPQEIMQRETDARLAQAQEISNRTGVPIERVLGLQEKYGTYMYGGGTYNKDTGEINNPAVPKPVGAPVKMTDESGAYHYVQKYQDGTMRPVEEPQGLKVPTPTAEKPTVKTTTSTFNPETGTTSSTTTTQKVEPSKLKSTRMSVIASGGVGTVGKPGGVVSEMAKEWAEDGIKPPSKYMPYVQKYMAANDLKPGVLPSGQAKSRADAGVAIKPLIEQVRSELQDPDVRAQMGIFAGRTTDVERRLGTIDPRMAKLYGNLKSIYSLAGAMHGWRAIKVADEFEKAYGSLKTNPDALLGGMDSMNETADAVIDAGYNSISGKSKGGAVATPASGVTHVWDPTKGLVPVGGKQ